MRNLFRYTQNLSFFIIYIALTAFLKSTSFATEIITFEESIPIPDSVVNQYCSKGVKIISTGGQLNGAKIFTPAVTTASPIHALTNNFGNEFDENLQLGIGFTTGQSNVSVKVGLDRSYPSFTFGVVAEMYAYSSDTPGTGFITSSDINLGNSATAITQTLQVNSSQGDIKSVLIRFKGAGVGQNAFEVIDDLTFTTAGPPCGVSDTTTPSVQINMPSKPGQSIYNPNMLLDFTATDNQSGVGKIEVSFSDTSDNVLQSFYTCGAPGVSQCPSTPGQVHYAFYTWLPKAPQSANYPLIVRITAWDYAGNEGKAERGIILYDYSGKVNLWAQGMEITQGTQPWVATNIFSRAGGSPPDFIYAAAPTSVPLVANRTTVVRVYPGLEGASQIDKVKAVLRCYSDPGFTVPCSGSASIEPEYIQYSNQAPKSLKEIMVNSSFDMDTMQRLSTANWNFKLPKEWTKAGDVYLEAEILPPAGMSECYGCNDAANRIRVSKVKFNQVPNFSQSLVHVVSVNRKDGGTIYSPTQAQISAQVDFLRDLYPVDETTLPTQANATLADNDDQLSGMERCDLLIGKLQSAFGNKAGKLAVHAIVDKGYPCAGKGGGGSPGYSFANAGRTESLAHEVGHAVGLNHAGNPPGHGSLCPRPDGGNCAECVNNWCDTDWPWPGGTIGAFGFDVFKMNVIPANRLECNVAGTCDNGINEDGDTWVNGWPMIDEDCPGTGTDWTNYPHDIMSYGPCGYWISPRNWTRIYNAFTGNNLPYLKKSGGASAPGAAANLDKENSNLMRVTGSTGNVSSAKYLIIRGQFDDNQGWILLPAYEMEFQAGTSDESGTGEYHIQLLNEEGKILSERFFNIVQEHMDILEPEGMTSLTSSPSFNELVPLPEEVTSLVLRRGADILTGITRTPAAPAVDIISPDASGFEGQPDNPFILWNGSDLDGDALHYMIQYSSRTNEMGEPVWETIGTDLMDQELSVSLDHLAGSNNAMVRVLVTDGFNTSMAVSPAFFVGNKPPKAEILSPENNIIFETGSRVVALGTAFDKEDGLLSSENLAWQSNIDGLIGSGQQIDLAVLSHGLHEITLTGQDSNGQTSSDVIIVEVTERINTQPIANAGSDKIIKVSRLIQLDGMGSSDEDGDALSFYWTITSKPGGSLPSLTRYDTAQPVFIADILGHYEIQLTVYDGKIGSAPDIVSVDVVDNQPPVANAGPDQTVERTSVAGAHVQLDGSGSYDPDGDPLTYAWTWTGGSTSGVYPIVTLPPGTTTVTLTVSDGQLSSTDTIDITVVDTKPPIVNIVLPLANVAVQDGVTLTAETFDLSGIDKVYFYVREPGGTNGIPIGYEGLTATYNTATGKWEYPFNTTILQDGYYVILAKAIDNAGNEGWSTVVPFSIRNWAVITLLPSTPNNKAGRTMPVKFSLRIAKSVDPAMPFVYNEDLEIRIYRCDNASCSSKTLMQTAVYGSGSTNYRINGELYITNFQTGKAPATYVVEIWRPSKNFMVGSFTFKTVK